MSMVDVTRSPVASGSPLHLVEQVDVQEEINDDLVNIAATNAANQSAHIVIPEDTVTDVAYVGEEVRATIQFDVPDGAYMEGVNRPLIVREEGMTHSNARIQQDLDLWQKINDYDQPHQRIHLSPCYLKNRSK